MSIARVLRGALETPGEVEVDVREALRDDHALVPEGAGRVRHDEAQLREVLEYRDKVQRLAVGASLGRRGEAAGVAEDRDVSLLQALVEREHPLVAGEEASQSGVELDAACAAGQVRLELLHHHGHVVEDADVDAGEGNDARLPGAQFAGPGVEAPQALHVLLLKLHARPFDLGLRGPSHAGQAVRDDPVGVHVVDHEQVREALGVHPGDRPGLVRPVPLFRIPRLGEHQRLLRRIPRQVHMHIDHLGNSHSVLPSHAARAILATAPIRTQ